VEARIKDLDKQQLSQRVTKRFFRALDYVSIFMFVVIVYGSAVIADYILFLLIWSLLREEVAKYPIVSSAFDYARIGLALLCIAGAIIHGILSTYNQIKIDIELAKE
jgi:hypothetical protein